MVGYVNAYGKDAGDKELMAQEERITLGDVYRGNQDQVQCHPQRGGRTLCHCDQRGH